MMMIISLFFGECAGGDLTVSDEKTMNTMSEGMTTCSFIPPFLWFST